MIIYVDLEHDRVQQFPQKWQESLARRLTIKYKLEDISGEPCLIVKYHKMTPELIREVNPKAILISGNATEFHHYEEAHFETLRQMVREATIPTMAFCGGFHLVGQAFGARAAAIEETASGTMDDDGWQNRTHEQGFTPVQKTAEHPLLAGLDDQMLLMEAHYWELKSVPEGFKNYAKTAVCPIQIIAHETLPVYATQSHPESWDDQHQDGRLLLKNFFRLVSEHWEK